jgi:orotidine-5'-phosphate decarboxylase
VEPHMKAELIVALDVASTPEAIAAVDSLPKEVGWYKIGLELFSAEGPAVVQAVKSRGKSVFLDLKLHDIPRTVERAVRAAAHHGADMLTVHASGGRAMLKAAAEAARTCGRTAPKIIAVTALTSLDQQDLRDLGVGRGLPEHVTALAELALQSGIAGLVCSPQEVENLRSRFGPQPLLVTPGIRPAGGEAGDQKRIATPAAAVRAGANFLVVGRPVLEAPDPAAAARAVLREMA